MTSSTVWTANSRLNRINERSTVAELRNSVATTAGAFAAAGLRRQRRWTNGQIRESASSQNRIRGKLKFAVILARLAADSHFAINGLAEANNPRKTQLISTGTIQTAMPDEMPGRFSAPTALRASLNGANRYNSRRARARSGRLS